MPANREWLDRGVHDKHAFMLVVCDTFDWEDYPVYADSLTELKQKAEEHHGPNMQKVMECYDLSMPHEPQLAELRAWHGWRP